MPGHQAWSVDAAASALQAMPAEERLILPSLQRIQSVFGWIPDDALDVIARELNVSRAEVVGVLTYYHDLRQSPPPDVHVQVCVAEACQAVGARGLATAIETSYGVPLGDAIDGVEFAKVYCLGDCALGPAVMVNGRLLGRCDLSRVQTAIASAQEVRA